MKYSRCWRNTLPDHRWVYHLSMTMKQVASASMTTGGWQHCAAVINAPIKEDDNSSQCSPNITGTDCNYQYYCASLEAL